MCGLRSAVCGTHCSFRRSRARPATGGDLNCTVYPAAAVGVRGRATSFNVSAVETPQEEKTRGRWRAMCARFDATAPEPRVWRVSQTPRLRIGSRSCRPAVRDDMWRCSVRKARSHGVSKAVADLTENDARSYACPHGGESRCHVATAS